MTTPIPLDDTGRIWLATSNEALTQIGHTIPYSILYRWTRDGHITPTRPAQGQGSDIGWSPHDIAALKAVTQVRQDLNTIGLPCTPPIVRELWDQLDVANTATITTTTVNITVHLGLEDT